VSLCDTCKKANVSCPVYPQKTDTCIEFASEAELLPCPFCGGTSMYMDTVYIDYEPNYSYVCRSCGCEGPYTPYLTVVEEIWNKRACKA